MFTKESLENLKEQKEENKTSFKVAIQINPQLPIPCASPQSFLYKWAHEHILSPQINYTMHNYNFSLNIVFGMVLLYHSTSFTKSSFNQSFVFLYVDVSYSDIIIFQCFKWTFLIDTSLWISMIISFR